MRIKGRLTCESTAQCGMQQQLDSNAHSARKHTSKLLTPRAFVPRHPNPPYHPPLPPAPFITSCPCDVIERHVVLLLQPALPVLPPPTAIWVAAPHPHVAPLCCRCLACVTAGCRRVLQNVGSDMHTQMAGCVALFFISLSLTLCGA